MNQENPVFRLLIAEAERMRRSCVADAKVLPAHSVTALEAEVDVTADTESLTSIAMRISAAASPNVLEFRRVAEKIMCGDIDICLPKVNTAVHLAVSCNEKDSDWEQRVLKIKVFPFLDELCKTLGLEFHTLDLRTLSREAPISNLTNEPNLTAIDKAFALSAGPAFLCFIGDNHGPCVLPESVEEIEFNEMVAFLETLTSPITVYGEDISITDAIALMKKWYIQDGEGTPYILKLDNLNLRPQSTAEITQIRNSLEYLFRWAASEVLPMDVERQKYFISPVEEELEWALRHDSLTRSGKKVVVFQRNLIGIHDFAENQSAIAAKFVDLFCKNDELAEIDAESQNRLNDIRNRTIPDQLYEIPWSEEIGFNPEDNEVHKEYLQAFVDDIAAVCSRSIIDQYSIVAAAREDSILDEVVLHRSMLLDTCTSLDSRPSDDVLAQSSQKAAEEIVTALGGSSAPVVVVHGHSGNSKTTAMALATRRLISILNAPAGVVVYRFLGATADSSNVRATIFSLCSQIARAYNAERQIWALLASELIDSSNKLGNRDTEQRAIKDLIKAFDHCLRLATEGRPLVIFLDGLNKLTDDTGRKVAVFDWLPKSVPSCVSIIVSVSTGGGTGPIAFKYLKESFPANFGHTYVKVNESPIENSEDIEDSKEKPNENQVEFFSNKGSNDVSLRSMKCLSPICGFNSSPCYSPTCPRSLTAVIDDEFKISIDRVPAILGGIPLNKSSCYSPLCEISDGYQCYSPSCLRSFNNVGVKKIDQASKKAVNVQEFDGVPIASMTCYSYLCNASSGVGCYSQSCPLTTVRSNQIREKTITSRKDVLSKDVEKINLKKLSKQFDVTSYVENDDFTPTSKSKKRVSVLSMFGASSTIKRNSVNSSDLKTPITPVDTEYEIVTKPPVNRRQSIVGDIAEAASAALAAATAAAELAAKTLGFVSEEQADEKSDSTDSESSEISVSKRKSINKRTSVIATATINRFSSLSRDDRPRTATSYISKYPPPIDPHESVEYFSTVAALYDDFAPEAHFELGRLHERGIVSLTGTSTSVRNMAIAAKHYRKAAEQGHSDAQFRLALFLENGTGGLLKNFSEAVKWYGLAAERSNQKGHPLAMAKLAECYRNGDGGLPKDLKESVRLLRQASDLGLPEAMFKLGECLEKGEGIEPNPTEAVRLYRQAAYEGHARAQNALGRCYLTGTGIARYPAAAFKFFEKAAAQGLPEGEYELGRCYQTGEGIAKDPLMAVKLLLRSAQKGHIEARYYLAQCYDQGIGVEKDKEEAIRLLRLAADAGHPKATHRLGMSYLNGEGLPRYPVVA
ncbi:hypothetical protein HK096_003932, partial [Nowakowskiella sp. JEL0078]